MPKIIFETDSELNGRIRIVDVGSTRKMVVGNTIQSINPDSPACPKLYWGQMSDSIKERFTDIQNILILGLGGGTLAHLLSRAYPDVNITSVEYDEVMIQLAKEYFYVDKISNHKIIHEDALRIVVEPEENDITPSSLDLVVVDVLNGDKYPDLGKTGNFISAVKRLIRPGGHVVFSRIYTEFFQEEVNIFVDSLENYFSEVETEVVAGYTNSDNLLIFGKV
ncbi:MAG TPA: class I SAM-dependent methyltransferase [bacterium]|nr:class I SAM-dependent methyltransferase [Patescibacteria group bacterium]HNU76227.1 class I SAM-dependent methyltransferase [bacterium]HRY56908.1 class I SAM-dependent methyltransferase [Patescibacteria group bacterium]